MIRLLEISNQTLFWFAGRAVAQPGHALSTALWQDRLFCAPLFVAL